MSTVKEFLRSRSTIVWAALSGVTLVSLTLGTDNHASSRWLETVIIIALALAKVQLIGWHFMELRHAPRWLRAIFSSYVVAVFVLISSMYLLTT